jgi:hypothetical protein
MIDKGKNARKGDTGWMIMGINSTEDVDCCVFLADRLSH